MPMIDKPLAELKTYMGSSPKPADFDAYWDKALAELAATDPKAEFVPAKVQIKNFKCFDVYFMGTKGARVHAKHVIPEKFEGKLKGLLQFHGYSGDSGDFVNLVQYAAMGYAVFALDARGQGNGESEDVGGYGGATYKGQFIRGVENEDPHKLLFRDIFLDTAQLARVAAETDYVDENDMTARGGSQGGALTLACASLYPNLKRAYATFPFLCDYKRVWDMDMDVRAYEELRTYFRYCDPMHEREDEIFMRLGYIDIANLAPRIKAKTTFFTGLMDDVCPPSTQFAAYNRMTCEKDMVIYPDFGHETIKGRGDVEARMMLDD